MTRIGIRRVRARVQHLLDDVCELHPHCVWLLLLLLLSVAVVGEELLARRLLDGRARLRAEKIEKCENS